MGTGGEVFTGNGYPKPNSIFTCFTQFNEGISKFEGRLHNVRCHLPFCDTGGEDSKVNTSILVTNIRRKYGDLIIGFFLVK